MELLELALLLALTGVVVVDALPLTPVLKIDKRALKELAATTELTRS